MNDHFTISEERKTALLKAGKIAAEALEYGRTMIKPGVKLLEVVEKVEEKIRQLGGNIAFPAQSSVNDIAAHYCPKQDDKIIYEDQVVKLDIGVEIGGYVADTALTVDLSKSYSDLVKASKDALDSAIMMVQIGAELGEIGRAIQEAIESYGYKSVRNLSGHGIGKYTVHTWPTIPNFDNGDKTKLEKGMSIAIEPFASTGAGMIFESGEPTVHMMIGKKGVRNPITRNVLEEINKFNGLPFAKRWLISKFGEVRVNLAFRELEQLGILRNYPPLVDKNRGLVSQAEHSLYIDDEIIVLTRL